MFVVRCLILWKSTQIIDFWKLCVKSLCSILLVLCYVRGSVLCCAGCVVECVLLYFVSVYIVLCNMLFVFMLCCDLDLCLCCVVFFGVKL
jgi:hypothetical protein